MNASAPCLPVAAIVLAAGASTRMGRLKQTLPFAQGTLIEHAIRQALAADFKPVIVVVGAEADTVREAVANQSVEIVFNPAWERGMGSSVAAGIRWIQESSADCAAVALLLADQPLVVASHLRQMRALLHTSNAPIVAAEYNGTVGVPAFFKRPLFAVLASLPPDAGARHVLRNPGIQVTAFPLPQAGIDIDTPEDFAALVSEITC